MKDKAPTKPASKTKISKVVETTKKSATKSKPARSTALRGSTPEKPRTAIIKTRKRRAPKDLAEQYGAPDKKKPTRKVEVEATPRKRMNAKTRELRKQVIEPSAEVLQRLTSSGAIASENGDAPRTSARRKARPRGWESHCGKCGTSSRFTKAAGLCARCGTIMIRT